jgi:hypothetical protein
MKLTYQTLQYPPQMPKKVKVPKIFTNLKVTNKFDEIKLS